MSGSVGKNAMFVPLNEVDEQTESREEEVRVPTLRDRLAVLKSKLTSLNGDVVGLGCSIMSAFLLSILALFSKVCTNAGIPAFQVTMVRSTIQFVVCMFYLLAIARIHPFGFPLSSKGLFGLLCSRAFFGAMANCLWIYALKLLPLGDGVLVTFLAPAFTAILGYLILKEKLTLIEVGGYFLCFVGMVFVARPSFLFGSLGLSPVAQLSSSWLSSSSSGISYSDLSRILGVFLGVCHALSLAIALISSRKIGKRAHPLVVINYYSLTGMIISPPGAYLFEGGFVMTKSVKVWLSLLALSLAGLTSQWFVTMGLRFGRAGRVTVGGYTQIIFAFILGAIVLGEIPSWLSIIGSACIAGSAGISAYKGWKSTPSPSPSAPPPASLAEVVPTGEGAAGDSTAHSSSTPPSEDIEMQQPPSSK